jgi:phosphotransacetylase
MEERKMTAVEWLVEQIYRNPIAIYKEEIFNQAKQMEKEQTIEAYDACDDDIYYKDGEDYYNQTYKNK